MSLVNRLKETAESYDEFLNRVRSEERDAKDHLPENRLQHIEWEKEMEFEEMMQDPETVYWGYMNGWGPVEEERYRGHLDAGIKFKTIRDRSSGTIYYSPKMKVYFRVESR